MPMIRRRTGRKGKRWQWRVSLKGLHERYGTCPTKECARLCADKAERALKAGQLAGEVTLNELLDAYAASYLPEIPDSAAKYREHLTWWRRELGVFYVSAITPQILAGAKARLKSEPCRRGGKQGDETPARKRSNATVNRYFTALASVWTWAMRPEVALASRHVVREVVRLPEPKGRVRWLSRPVDESECELHRLLAACRKSESPLLFDVVMLLLCTGCRENEIMALRRIDVRLAERGFTITADAAKNEEARFVALEGSGFDVVQKRLAKCGNSEFLFPGSSGRNAWFPWRAWRTALRRAHISNFRPHDLRHKHGSYLAMLGKSLPEIMAALGHKTPAAAFRYIHLADAHKRQVAVDVTHQLAIWAK
jgi:integrase